MEARQSRQMGQTAKPTLITTHRKAWLNWLLALGLVLLVVWPRLTNLNQYLIVDEADRWRWAEDFTLALNRGDLAGTLVGDGYPGIAPVWLESGWIFGEAVRRSLSEGQWIGEAGLYHLFHEWDRTEYLSQQRLPIVLFNIVIALAIIWAVWRLFGRQAALASGLLIALDPFYLSDSRVNRAEAVITGLMTLSILFLIFYTQQPRWRYVIISGVLGGLSFLTKIQALTILPIVAVTAGLIFLKGEDKKRIKLKDLILQPSAFSLIWVLAAALTWLLLWPSMWVTPLETLALVYDYTTRKVGDEGVSLFFLGQTYLDTDPGVLFYPVVLLLRITPLVLLGLLGAALRFTLYVLPPMFGGTRRPKLPGDPFTVPGSSILVTYVVLYSLIMTAGSHKQDRYLMPVFLGLDILAGLGLVFLWLWASSKFLVRLRPSTQKIIGGAVLAGLVIVQATSVLPHHPYYYSYFNPLFGGGRTAVKALRIGWGEGMDQVGAYLAAKPNSQDLVVSSRFTHNMLNFKGELIALGPGGSWTRADYIVLYIQQVQRRLDPSPGFIDYFLARPPEKVITIGGIDYAWIYPTPFATPADPQVSQIPGQVALLGYSWETNQPTTSPSLRLWWENLGLAGNRSLMARLVGPTAATGWTVCQPDPAFTAQAKSAGALVESSCTPELTGLPPAFYTVEFGLSSQPSTPADITPFLFPQGWQAAQLGPTGEVSATPELARLEAIAQQVVPAGAVPLDRVYPGRIRLLAYHLEPAQPRPGGDIELTLYWQAAAGKSEPVQLTVQVADSRSIELGRSDSLLPRPGQARWLPGEVIAAAHRFALAASLEAPLAAQIEVRLKDQANIGLEPSTLTGEKAEPVIGRFTVAPPAWPAPANATPADAIWQNESGQEVALRGYTVTPAQVQPGQELLVDLLWAAGQPLTEDYTVFVHLLDEAGQIVSQHDSLPRTGAYPTLWWQPGQVVEDGHPLLLPEDLPAGDYRLVVGLYRSAGGQRLLLTDSRDAFVVETVEIKR